LYVLCQQLERLIIRILLRHYWSTCHMTSIIHAAFHKHITHSHLNITTDRQVWVLLVNMAKNVRPGPQNKHTLQLCWCLRKIFPFSIPIKTHMQLPISNKTCSNHSLGLPTLLIREDVRSLFSALTVNPNPNQCSPGSLG